MKVSKTDLSLFWQKAAHPYIKTIDFPQFSDLMLKFHGHLGEEMDFD
jgi:hypothetical protein